MTPQFLPALAGSTHPVTAVGGAGTGRRYGAVFTMRLPTGGLADELAVADADVRLTGGFSAMAYDALSAVAPLTASLDTTTDGAVIVQLDGPRLLSSVRLQPSAPATSSVLVHRVDGRVRADEPTLVVGGAASASGQLHTVAEAFVADRFALRRRTTGGDVALTGSQLKAVVVTGGPDNPTLGVRLAAAAASPLPLFTGAVDGGVDFDVRALAEALRRVLGDLPGPLPDPVEVEVVAGADGPCHVRFDVATLPYRLTTSGFANLPLRQSDIADPGELLARLRGAPEPVSAHLRAGLSGRAREAVDARAGNALGAALADLSAVLSGGSLWEPSRFAGVTLPVEASALVAESPASARRDRLNRLLLEAAWPGVLRSRSEPRRLDVTANAAGPEVAVTVPPEAAAVSGVLVVHPFTERARPTATEAASVGTAGVAIDGQAAVAVAIDTVGAARTEGVEVALLVRDATGTFSGELRADHRGQPDGTVVRAGPVAVATRGAGGWARLRFTEPLTLQPGRTWVVLHADAGRAVWLAAEPAPAAAAALRIARSGGPWETVRAAGPAPAVRLVVASDGAGPAVTLTGATTVEAAPRADGALAFALDGLLAEGSVVAMRLPSVADGQLVVDPPTVTYDLT